MMHSYVYIPYVYMNHLVLLTLYNKFSRALFRGDDIERGKDFLNVNDGLVGFVGPWNSQL